MKYKSLQENDIRKDYNNLSPHLLQFVISLQVST